MVALSELTEQQRDEAQRRFAVLRPHLEDGVALAQAAAAAGVPVRTARHWLMRFRAGGLPALARVSRRDRDTRRQPPELVMLIEGLALRRPRSSTAHIHRQAIGLAGERGWPAPGYGTVRSIVAALDPGLVTLAHDGPAAYRDQFELVFRREAAAANAIWQADHTQLDVMILDPAGRPVRPWLTVILDDFSRAIAGYAVNLGAPSALQTALALRQAIWRKSDPAWTVCGLPEVLYSDHGSDFKSRHLEQVSADLRIQLINSTAGVPQGRGKIERLFGTVTTELLPQLPGYLPPPGAGPSSAPRLSLGDLDAAVGRWISTDYHASTLRDQEAAAGVLGRRWLAAAHARLTRATRPAAARRRQAPHRASRRHPVCWPALPGPHSGNQSESAATTGRSGAPEIQANPGLRLLWRAGAQIVPRPSSSASARIRTSTNIPVPATRPSAGRSRGAAHRSAAAAPSAASCSS